MEDKFLILIYFDGIFFIGKKAIYLMGNGDILQIPTPMTSENSDEQYLNDT